MTLSLIWQPRAGTFPIYGPDILRGYPMARVWDGFPFPSWETTLRGNSWSARQIARWETKYGKVWNGESWPRP